MKRSRLLLISTAASCLFQPTPAQAQVAASDYLTFAIGYFDIFGNEGATDLRFEYRPGKTVLVDDLHPWAGMEGTTDGTLWLGGGLLYDWNFSGNWHLTPSLGAGLYTQGKSDKDLDYPIQFRSQLEISYQYNSGVRTGVNLSHMSNASFGNHNPGAETLGMSISYPF